MHLSFFCAIVYSNIPGQLYHTVMVNQHGFFKSRTITSNICCLTEYAQSVPNGCIQVDVKWHACNRCVNKSDYKKISYKLDKVGLKFKKWKIIDRYWHILA